MIYLPAIEPHFKLQLFYLQLWPIAAIAVESTVKNSFVSKGMQTRQKGQYNAELILSPCLCVKPLITAITAICCLKMY